uniref:BAR domain-containing protein n=1 Tax=Meloidogyne incognita TaxID=6306 RepID=A0A914LEW5_MELIC
MCDAGSKMLDYLKVETNKRECTERIESGFKKLAKIFVESVRMDYSEDKIFKELSKVSFSKISKEANKATELKKDNTEYSYAMEEYDKLMVHGEDKNLNLLGNIVEDFDKWYDAEHKKETKLNLPEKNIMAVKHDKGIMSLGTPQFTAAQFTAAQFTAPSLPPPSLPRAQFTAGPIYRCPIYRSPVYREPSLPRAQFTAAKIFIIIAGEVVPKMLYVVSMTGTSPVVGPTFPAL